MGIDYYLVIHPLKILFFIGRDVFANFESDEVKIVSKLIETLWNPDEENHEVICSKIAELYEDLFDLIDIHPAVFLLAYFKVYYENSVNKKEIEVISDQDDRFSDLMEKGYVIIRI